VCVCCRVHAELASGRVSYSTVELQCGIFEGKNVILQIAFGAM